MLSVLLHANSLIISGWESRRMSALVKGTRCNLHSPKMHVACCLAEDMCLACYRSGMA